MIRINIVALISIKTEAQSSVLYVLNSFITNRSFLKS